MKNNRDFDCNLHEGLSVYDDDDDDDDDDSGVEPTTLCCHGLHLTKKRDHTHARGIAPFGTASIFALVQPTTLHL